MSQWALPCGRTPDIGRYKGWQSGRIFRWSDRIAERTRPADSSTECQLAALAASGTLNRDPQTVRDPLFRGGGFFDPRDLLQLRYEMIRRHRIENLSVAVTAELFGVSLPTAYQAHTAFDAGGLAGLLPKRRGPKQGHKLTPEILAHIEQRWRERPDWRTSDMQTDLQQRFGLTVHRRSLERVLRGKKKLPRA
jgi:transposase